MLDTIERQPKILENLSELNSKSYEDYWDLETATHIGLAAMESEVIIDNNSLVSNYLKDYSDTFNHVIEGVNGLEAEQADIPAYELRRMPLEVFVGVLVDSGVMSQDLVDSGILDRFSPDRLSFSEGIEQYRGGFRHIFLGDIRGGLHDIDTLEDAGLAGVGMDTARVSPTKRGNDRREKIGLKIIENPDLVKGTGMDTDGDGETDVVRIRRLDATSQFPENWTTDRVVTEIVSIVDSTEGTLTKDKKRIEHSSTIVENINGVDTAVNVVVFTDSATGLIESAYTQRGDRSKS